MNPWAVLILLTLVVGVCGVIAYFWPYLQVLL